MYKSLRLAKTILLQVVKTQKGADPESARRAKFLHTRDAAEVRKFATDGQKRGISQLEGKERKGKKGKRGKR